MDEKINGVSRRYLEEELGLDILDWQWAFYRNLHNVETAREGTHD